MKLNKYLFLLSLVLINLFTLTTEVRKLIPKEPKLFKIQVNYVYRSYLIKILCCLCLSQKKYRYTEVNVHNQIISKYKLKLAIYSTLRGSHKDIWEFPIEIFDNNNQPLTQQIDLDNNNIFFVHIY